MKLGELTGLSRLREFTSMASGGCGELEVGVDVDSAAGSAVSSLSRLSVSGSLVERASGPVGDGWGERDTPSYDVDSSEWDRDDEVEAVDDGKAGEGGLGSGDVRAGGRE